MSPWQRRECAEARLDGVGFPRRVFGAVVPTLSDRSAHLAGRIRRRAQRLHGVLVTTEADREARAGRVELDRGVVEVASRPGNQLVHRSAELRVGHPHNADRSGRPGERDGGLVEQRAQVGEVGELAVVPERRELPLTLGCE